MIHNIHWGNSPWNEYCNVSSQEKKKLGKYFSKQLNVPTHILMDFTAKQLDKHFTELKIYEIFNDAVPPGDS